MTVWQYLIRLAYISLSKNRLRRFRAQGKHTTCCIGICQEKFSLWKCSLTQLSCQAIKRVWPAKMAYGGRQAGGCQPNPLTRPSNPLTPVNLLPCNPFNRRGGGCSLTTVGIEPTPRIFSLIREGMLCKLVSRWKNTGCRTAKLAAGATITRTRIG